MKVKSDVDVKRRQIKFYCPGCNNLLLIRSVDNSSPVHNMEICPYCGKVLTWKKVNLKEAKDAINK